MVFRTFWTRKKGEIGKIIHFGDFSLNKTKYFRLRLSDEVSTDRPEIDLRLT